MKKLKQFNIEFYLDNELNEIYKKESFLENLPENVSVSDMVVDIDLDVNVFGWVLNHE